MDRSALEDVINETLDGMIGNLYKTLEQEDTRYKYTGDISPLDSLELDDIVSRIADLFEKLASENKRDANFFVNGEEIQPTEG